jgi:hypothetical protein
VAHGSGGYYPGSVIVADLNGDDKLDLVVVNWCVAYNVCPPSDSTVSVMLGNGDGTFQPEVAYDTGGYYAQYGAVADVNADGKLDLLVANEGAGNIHTGSIGVLLGNGDGTFQSAVTYSIGNNDNQIYIYSVAAADVNLDGKLDLAVGAYRGSTIMLGNGDGTFQAPATYNGFGPVAVADVNSDGKPDLLSLDGVQLGNGDGTFQPLITYNANSGYGPDAIISADLNADGKLDDTISSLSGPGARTLAQGKSLY